MSLCHCRFFPHPFRYSSHSMFSSSMHVTFSTLYVEPAQAVPCRRSNNTGNALTIYYLFNIILCAVFGL